MDRAYKIEKKRILAWRVLLLLQLLCLFGLGVLFHGEKQTEILGKEQFQIHYGEYTKENGYLIDESSGIAGEVCLETQPLQLAKGVYRVELRFRGDAEQVCKVMDHTLGPGELQVNSISLRDQTKASGSGVTFRLKKPTQNLRIQILYTGTGSFQLQEMKLIHTKQEYGMALWKYLFYFLLMDAVFIIADLSRRGRITVSQRRVILALGGAAFLLSIPVLINYINVSDDMMFHFTRIEGITRAWREGQFPARMQPNWLNEMGYPVSIMYGDLLLWPVAYMHGIGYDLMTSYKIGMVFWNVLTVLCSYLAFQGAFQNPGIAVAGSMVYSFSHYRLYNVYVRGAVGEFTAMIFIPLIFAGLWELFGKEKQERSEKRAIVFLTVGFTGVLLSHVLSFELCCMATLFVCLFQGKRFFSCKIWWVLIRAAGLTILLNLWFLVPFLDYMMSLPMIVLHNVRMIQDAGLQLRQLLSLGVFLPSTARPIGMGIALTIVWVFFWIWIRKEKEKGYEYRCVLSLGILGSCMAIMSLLWFPWDKISGISTVTEKVVSSLQFPYRLLTIVTICATMLFCILVRRMGWRFGFVIVGVSLITGLFFTDDYLQTRGAYELRNAEAMGSETISGMEYILEGTKKEELPYNRLSFDENVKLVQWEKEGGKLSVTCENPGDTQAYIDTNYLYYPGYCARDRKEGSALNCEIGENNVLRVQLPAGYRGTFQVSFLGQWYWRVADGISLLALAGVLLWALPRPVKVHYVQRFHFGKDAKGLWKEKR